MARNVLLVDDEEVILDILEGYLGAEDFVATRAGNGIEALELLDRKGGFDLVITDYKMPKLGGKEFLNILKERYPGVLVIVITGFIDSDTAIEMLNSGVFGFVSKPISRAEFMKTVKEAMRANKILRERIAAMLDQKDSEITSLQTTFLGLLNPLLFMLEEKLSHKEGHSMLVSAVSRMIGHHLSLSQREMRMLTFAALLHDIGIFGIPEAVLNKKEKLTDEEYGLIKTHPMRSIKIAGELMSDLMPVIFHHHEQYDGSGYPDGLAGEKIPLLSRIINVADSLTAMMSERPYRKAILVEAAIEELADKSGKQFDPKLVKILKDNKAELIQILATEHHKIKKSK